MVCLINLKHITKTFNTKDGDVHAVKDVSLQIDEGQIYGIIGFPELVNRHWFDASIYWKNRNMAK